MGEVVLCLLAVAVISSVAGWLLHGVFGQGKFKALEAAKDLELEGLRGELETQSKGRQEAAGALEKSIAKVKELDVKVAASAQQLTDAKSQHETAAGKLKEQIAALEPLSGAVAERDARLAGWQERFDGLVQEKDKLVAAGLAELAEHKTKLGAMGLTLAAAVAEKDALGAQVAGHVTSLAAVKAAKDAHLADLRGKLAEAAAAKDALEAQVAGHVQAIESVKAEKDFHLADLSAKLSDAVAAKGVLQAQIAGHVQAVESVKAEKDADVAGLSAKLAEVGAAKDALHSQIAEHLQAIESIKTQKDAHVSDLSAKLGEAGAAKDALQAQIGEHAQTIESHAAKLVELDAVKDALHAQIAEHVQAIDSVKAAHDAHAGDLHAKLAVAEQTNSDHASKLSEMTILLGQRDEQLKSFDQRMRGAAAEKDTIIGKLRSMVSQIEPMRQELQLRDHAIEQMQARMALLAVPQAGPSAPTRPSPDLEETQRQLHAVLATTVSLKTALEGKDAEIAALAAKTAPAPTPLAERLTSTLAVLADKEQALSALELQLKDAQATHQDLLTAQEERAALVQSQAIDVTGRHAAAQSELDDYSTRNAELEARLRQEADQHEAAGREVAAKQEELDKARAELASLDTRTMTAFDQLKARITQLEKALDEDVPREAKLLETIKADESQMAELRAQIAHRDEQLANTAMLESQVLDLTGRHAEAKGELNTYAARFAELESRMREQVSEHGATTRSVDAKQNELEKSQAEVADLDSKLTSALDAPVTPNDDRVSMLENQVVDVTVRHAAAKSELEDWSTRYAELAARAREQAAEHEAATRSVAAKQAELDKARAEVANLDAKLMTIPTLEAELADLRGQLVDRDERLEAWDSRFHASIGELRGEIGELTARLHGPDAELHKMRSGLLEAPGASLLATTSMAAAAGFAGGSATPAAHSPAQRHDDARQLHELLQAMSLHGVQFLPASAELIPQSLPILAKAANAMHRFPDVRVEVAGHTDSWGTPEENLDLSQRRAGAVKEYLINSGIAAWRLIEAGYGHSRPVDSNDTADGRFANRRIEFHML